MTFPKAHAKSDPVKSFFNPTIAQSIYEKNIGHSRKQVFKGPWVTKSSKPTSNKVSDILPIFTSAKLADIDLAIMATLQIPMTN